MHENKIPYVYVIMYVQIFKGCEFCCSCGQIVICKISIIEISTFWVLLIEKMHMKWIAVNIKQLQVMMTSLHLQLLRWLQPHWGSPCFSISSEPDVETRPL